MIEIKCTINLMCLNHPETIPPKNWSLVPKRLGINPQYFRSPELIMKRMILP